jgi:hypothetical protein
MDICDSIGYKITLIKVNFMSIGPQVAKTAVITTQKIT